MSSIMPPAADHVTLRQRICASCGIKTRDKVLLSSLEETIKKCVHSFFLLFFLLVFL